MIVRWQKLLHRRHDLERHCFKNSGWLNTSDSVLTIDTQNLWKEYTHNDFWYVQKSIPLPETCHFSHFFFYPLMVINGWTTNSMCNLLCCINGAGLELQTSIYHSATAEMYKTRELKDMISGNGPFFVISNFSPSKSFLYPREVCVWCKKMCFL